MLLYLCFLGALLLARASSQGASRSSHVRDAKAKSASADLCYCAAEAGLSLGLATSALPADEQVLIELMAGTAAADYAAVEAAQSSAGPTNYLTDKAGSISASSTQTLFQAGFTHRWCAVQVDSAVPLTPVNHSAFESMGRRLAETCGNVAGAWGQCGGQSNCPAGAACGDRDWYPTVCCPIVQNVPQVLNTLSTNRGNLQWAHRAPPLT